jgi:hypothetical protein
MIHDYSRYNVFLNVLMGIQEIASCLLGLEPNVQLLTLYPLKWGIPVTLRVLAVPNG